MKIAITSQGETLEAQAEERFGRCRWILIIDTETGNLVARDNEIQRDAVQGAGIQTAEKILREEVDCVVTGHCGPKAFRVLQAAGIKIYLGAEGTGAKVLKDYQEGKLKLAAHFQLSVSVCINKWDLNPEQTGLIESQFLYHKAKLAGRIPYDPVFSKAQVKGISVSEMDSIPVKEAVDHI